MSHWLVFVTVMAALQVAVLVAEEGTACANILPAENLHLEGHRKWYYCKSSGDTSDNGCFIEVQPVDNVLVHRRTSYNKDKKKLEVETFNITQSSNPLPGRNAVHVNVAVTSDENCMLAVKCWTDTPPFLLFVCRTSSACSGGTYKSFLEDEISKLRTKDGMEGLKTDLEDYYNSEHCGE